MPYTITTDTPPDAAPIGASLVAPVNPGWTTVCEAPNFNIPASGYNATGQRVNVDGVIEITSPLLACNVTSSTAWISARIVRANGAVVSVVFRAPVPAGDVLPVPLNGQFLRKDDRLEVQAQTATAIHCTMSYTQGLAEPIS